MLRVVVLLFVLCVFAKRELTSEEQEFKGLEAHNIFRQIHQVPQMTLNGEMCKEAEDYAKILARKGSLEHSKETNDGENLAFSCSSDDKTQTVGEAVKNWYNEVCKPGYNFKNGGFSAGTGHFTQVVWKGSTDLGIGVATGNKHGMKCTYIVARYRPAGNFMGRYQENVLKGSFDAERVCASVNKLVP
ncbi:Golgi-associated plant pathogenesis-related protein 1-like [Orbicella faveolata]|uniref:Golgi-associated plant pathogenesis-related protein 1-like n=1 Tax=Orbicella faveolata TaxID=48498 RepID=UPI0009E4186D|nr:Golgi-associated plant pathogenesis-related protein 1-like [Orbicella faveolata]